MSAQDTEALSASQASYRLPHLLRCVNQFRALARPADRAWFDYEAKVFRQKCRAPRYSVSAVNSGLLPKIPECSRKYFIFRVMYTDRFIPYKEAIIEAYQRQRALGDDEWLIKPTRHRVRKECYERILSGLEKQDERTVRRYLKMEPGDNDFLTAIDDKDGDDFSAFENFLQKPQIKTAPENVELLAWLIGFPARPYANYIEGQQLGGGNDANSGTPEITGTGSPDQQTAPKEKPVTDIPAYLPGDSAGKQKFKFYTPWLIGLTTLLIIAIVWIIINKQDCMYWSDDHYIATSCSIPRGETPLIEYNRDRFENFHKLNRTDTLTRNSIGRLWFTRVGDSLEVFTMQGRHPLYKDKKLKELTDFAINFCRNRKNKIGGR